MVHFSSVALAQGGETIYVIQPGDSLSKIAATYGVGLTDLADWNNIANPNLVFVGQKITIPADNLLLRPPPTDEQTYTIQPGDTLFTIANIFGVSLTELAQANNISNVDIIRVGQVLRIPFAETDNTRQTPPFPFESISLSHNRVLQGKTLAIEAVLTEPGTVTITFDGRSANVYQDGERHWGILGIHALQETGIYPITIEASLIDGRQISTNKNVIVVDGGYSTEHIEVTEGVASLLTPETIQTEFERLRQLWSQVSPIPRWEQGFGYPVDAVRFTSFFGTRRSYNSGPVSSFHTGADLGGAPGTPLYAPAPGTVVLAEALDVRGNAVLIDHGLGVYSGYWHQNEIAVTVGEEVWQGQVIGYLGKTGLVTGPHLHWELRINGIAVDPTQWVQETFP